MGALMFGNQVSYFLLFSVRYHVAVSSFKLTANVWPLDLYPIIY
jgi:hypothetical protein